MPYGKNVLTEKLRKNLTITIVSLLLGEKIGSLRIIPLAGLFSTAGRLDDKELMTAILSCSSDSTPFSRVVLRLMPPLPPDTEDLFFCLPAASILAVTHQALHRVSKAKRFKRPKKSWSQENLDRPVTICFDLEFDRAHLSARTNRSGFTSD